MIVDAAQVRPPRHSRATVFAPQQSHYLIFNFITFFLLQETQQILHHDASSIIFKSVNTNRSQFSSCFFVFFLLYFFHISLLPLSQSIISRTAPHQIISSTSYTAQPSSLLVSSFLLVMCWLRTKRLLEPTL